MTWGTTRAIAWVAVLAGASCDSPCQDLCQKMADYAEECKLSVTDAEISSCVDRMGQDQTSDSRQACRNFGDPEVIRAQWSCDDLAAYWTDGT